ncbi:MAG: hypothetical protein KF729_04185, partial [Sandaracinaceae bacterium]|nr:hypothetical protein [Sandaracinaceae bacterium]
PARPAGGGGRGGSDIDSLLDSALGGGGGGGARRGGSATPAPAASGGGGGGGGGGGAASGPQTPSRGDIVSAMNGVSGAVGACGNGTAGTATVRVIFSGSTGRVQSANVSGANIPAPVSSCIARAVRSASVPPFRQDTFSVNYPFRIQ